jgi:large subunit ribosomal protein L22
MRLVADLVKGMPVEQALGVLHFSPRVAARHIAKTIKSAAANALSLEGTDNLKPEDLVVRSITVDAAPTAKRIRFQSMGRVYRIRKRYCHLTVKVEAEVQQEMKKTRVRKAKSKEAEPEKEPEKSKPKAPAKTRAKASAKTKTRTKTTSKAGGSKTATREEPKARKTKPKQAKSETARTGKAAGKAAKDAAPGDDS